MTNQLTEVRDAGKFTYQSTLSFKRNVKSSSGLTVACQLLSFLSLPSGTLCSVAG